MLDIVILNVSCYDCNQHCVDASMETIMGYASKPNEFHQESHINQLYLEKFQNIAWELFSHSDFCIIRLARITID